MEKMEKYINRDIEIITKLKVIKHLCNINIKPYNKSKLLLLSFKHDIDYIKRLINEIDKIYNNS